MSLIVVLLVLCFLLSLNDEAYRYPLKHKVLAHWYRSHEEKNTLAFYGIQFSIPVLIPVFYGTGWEVGITAVGCFFLWVLTCIGYVLVQYEDLIGELYD